MSTKAISSRPRRRTVIPDWPEHVKFDEKEEAIAFDGEGKRHLVRGPVQPKDLKKKMKADIVILVRKHFVIADIELFDKVILKRTSKYWKNYRYFLRENYFDPMTRTDDQNYDNRPDGVFKQNWTNLVDYWYSPEFQEKEKWKFSELDFYKSVYTKKDGSFKEGTLSQQFMEDANNKVKECLASSSKSRVDIENEVFNDLMYNGEVPKRPLNYGFGVKQSDIFGVQGLLRKEGSSYVNHSAIEMENLKVEFPAIKKQNEDLR
ncbi:S-adenosylmethionine:tRNA ribosyltransferase-isomerase [Bienertia sinuspersici]